MNELHWVFDIVFIILSWIGIVLAYRTGRKRNEDDYERMMGLTKFYQAEMHTFQQLNIDYFNTELNRKGRMAMAPTPMSQQPPQNAEDEELYEVPVALQG